MEGELWSSCVLGTVELLCAWCSLPLAVLTRRMLICKDELGMLTCKDKLEILKFKDQSGRLTYKTDM